MLKFFDRLEDKARASLSRVPIVYAMIGGVTIVLFWRSIWEVADILYMLGGVWSIIFDPVISLFLSTLVLLFTGIFVSFFIGDRIILSGLKHEKKIEEKTEEEVREEDVLIHVLNTKIDKLTREVEEMKNFLKR